MDSDTNDLLEADVEQTSSKSIKHWQKPQFKILRVTSVTGQLSNLYYFKKKYLPWKRKKQIKNL
jgi:hypothetical protein